MLFQFGLYRGNFYVQDNLVIKCFVTLGKNLMTVAKNNAFQSQSGIFPAMADGFFVFLEPLSPGEHTLVLEQSVLNPVRPEYNFASKTTYVLTAEH